MNWLRSSPRSAPEIAGDRDAASIVPALAPATFTAGRRSGRGRRRRPRRSRRRVAWRRPGDQHRDQAGHRQQNPDRRQASHAASSLGCRSLRALGCRGSSTAPSCRAPADRRRPDRARPGRSQPPIGGFRVPGRGSYSSPLSPGPPPWSRAAPRVVTVGVVAAGRRAADPVEEAGGHVGGVGSQPGQDRRQLRQRRRQRVQRRHALLLDRRTGAARSANGDERLDLDQGRHRLRPTGRPPQQRRELRGDGLQRRAASG